VTGTPLTYSNMYNRVLRPALRDAGIAVMDDQGKWDYQGVAFHAFRKACGLLLFAHGKTLKQVQGFLRHAQLSTTLNVYINQVDDGLGGADVWDETLPSGGGGPSGSLEGRDGLDSIPVQPLETGSEQELLDGPAGI
jgi:hypothetical protein